MPGAATTPAASGDYHDDTVTALAIAEQMRLWVPTQVQVVSMAEELGVGGPLAGPSDPYTPLIPHTSAEVAAMMAEQGGWTLTNELGHTVNPLGADGFSGYIDHRYRVDRTILRIGDIY